MLTCENIHFCHVEVDRKQLARVAVNVCEQYRVCEHPVWTARYFFTTDDRTIGSRSLAYHVCFKIRFRSLTAFLVK